jgi:Phage integrase family/Arm DNA-binding domain
MRVRPTGRNTFEYRYRFEGRENLAVVGDCRNITCEEALDFATMLAGDIARGLDPQTRKTGQREEDMSGPMEPPKRAWNKVVKLAGVPDATLYTLRHSLASWAVADGVSLAIVGKLLGQTKPQTTQRYAHLRLDAGGGLMWLRRLRSAMQGEGSIVLLAFTIHEVVIYYNIY